MILIELIRTLWIRMIYSIGQLYSICKCKRANPTSFISTKVSISHTSFGVSCAVFGDTIVMNSLIDDYSYIQTNGRVFNCTIGKFCSVAAGVTIAPGVHDINCVTTHPALLQKSTPLPKVFATKDNLVTQKRVKIGHDVWIGEKAIVIDGITIGNGAVIAAGAVVVKDVAPYEVVGGVPARHIKYRFDQHTIDKLQASEWWNKDQQWLTDNANLFLNHKNFDE